MSKNERKLALTCNGASGRSGGYSVKSLKQIAKRKGLRGYSKLKREKLLALVCRGEESLSHSADTRSALSDRLRAAMMALEECLENKQKNANPLAAGATTRNSAQKQRKRQYDAMMQRIQDKYVGEDQRSVQAPVISERAFQRIREAARKKDAKKPARRVTPNKPLRRVTLTTTKPLRQIRLA